MTEISEIVGRVGFPIVIALILILDTGRRLERLTRAVSDLVRVVRNGGGMRLCRSRRGGRSRR